MRQPAWRRLRGPAASTPRDSFRQACRTPSHSKASPCPRLRCQRRPAPQRHRRRLATPLHVFCGKLRDSSLDPPAFLAWRLLVQQGGSWGCANARLRLLQLAGAPSPSLPEPEPVPLAGAPGIPGVRRVALLPSPAPPPRSSLEGAPLREVSAGDLPSVVAPSPWPIEKNQCLVEIFIDELPALCHYADGAIRAFSFLRQSPPCQSAHNLP